MKIYKHQNSEIFDSYVEFMLKKEASGKGEAVQSVVRNVLPGAARVAPEVAGVVADAAADLARIEKNMASSVSEIGVAREAIEALEGKVNLPKTYQNWTRKRFHEALKTEKFKARTARQSLKESQQDLVEQSKELYALIEKGELAKADKAAALEAYNKLQKQHDEATSLLKKMDAAEGKLVNIENSLTGISKKVDEGFEGVEKGLKGVDEGLKTQRTFLEDFRSEVIELITKASGKAPSEAVIKSLDDIEDVAEEAGKQAAITNKARQAGLTEDPNFKAVLDQMDASNKKLDDLAKKVDQANPGSYDEVADAIKKSQKEFEKTWSKKFDDAVKQMAKGGADEKGIFKTFLGEAATSAGKAIGRGVVGFATLAAVVGGIWWYMNSGEDEAAIALKKIDNLSIAVKDSIEKVKPLQFNAGSAGETQKNELLNALRNADAVIPELKTDINEVRAMQITETLDKLDQNVNSFLTNKEALKEDLSNPNGFDEAISSLGRLQFFLKDFKSFLQDTGKAMRRAGLDPGPAAHGGEEVDLTPGAGSGAPPLLIDIYDEKELNIAHLDKDDRSSVLFLVNKRLKHPVYMAFIDPDNHWGGAVQKTGNKRVDYLQSLKVLAQNNLTTPRKVKRWMRGRMRKMGEKFSAGWRMAVRRYRNEGAKFSNKINENLEKTANYIHRNEFSNNSGNIFMKKMADQFTNSYYQDAVKGLDEQYAKSYFAGLKGMYEQNFGRNKEADYMKLYQSHDETGAQLIGNAHSESVAVADAMGNGGLVENVLEQQRKNIGVALSAPTGNFRARHAQLIKELVKLANEADDTGEKDASNMIDKTINNLLGID